MLDIHQPSSSDSPVPVIGTFAPYVVVDDPTADLDRLGNEIAELSAHIQAATYQLLVLIREFDDRGGWGAAFARVPTGSSGEPASIWVLHARRFVPLMRWRTCPRSVAPCKRASSPTPRCGR